MYLNVVAETRFCFGKTKNYVAKIFIYSLFIYF